jgi:colanic acid biosynthesis protein WcaH
VPGGRIRKGERLQMAWNRICRDELGLVLPWSTAQLMGVFEHFYPDNFLGESASTHYVVHAYRLIMDDAVTGFPLQQHERLAWWSLETLIDSDQVHPYTRAYFSNLSGN